MLNSTDLNRVTTQLEQFGCTKTEAKIYVQLIKMGGITVQEVASQLGLNRVTVHSAIEQLIHKGLAYETRRGKKRLIIAEQPSTLFTIIQTKLNDLKIQENSLQYVVKLLNSIETQTKTTPTVKFYEGVTGFKKMLQETLSAKNEVLVFTFVDLFSKLLTPKYLENYYAKRAQKNIHTRLIFPSGEFGKHINKKSAQFKMKIKFLPENLKWKAGIFAWDNTIAIQSFTEEKLTCTIIENEDIAYFYRQIMFELCWKQASSASVQP